MPDRSEVKQIAVYVDLKFFRKVKREADSRHRKIGPAVLDILREYFDKEDKKQEAENVRNSTSETR